MAIAKFLKKLRLTLAYVTIFPVADSSIDTDLKSLACYLPIAGLTIGATLSLILLVLEGALPQKSMLVAGLLVALWLFLTGGLHFDGLLDTTDGISAHTDRDRTLEIMKDSRAGNFAIAVGAIFLLLKTCALSSILEEGGKAAVTVLILVPAWARWCELYAIARMPYARVDGKGKIWHETARFPGDLVKGSLAPLFATLLFVPLCHSRLAALVVCPTILGGIICAIWLNRKIGGQTGDTYGATVEFAELCGLVAAALLV